MQKNIMYMLSIVVHSAYCYLAVVRSYVGCVEACITYRRIKDYKLLLITYVHTHAYMSFCSHTRGFRCSILYESTHYSISEYN